MTVVPLRKGHMAPSGQCRIVSIHKGSNQHSFSNYSMSACVSFHMATKS